MTQRSERTLLANPLGGLGWPLLLGLSVSGIFYFLVLSGPLDTPLMRRYFASHPICYLSTGMFFVGLAALLMKLVEVGLQFPHLGRISFGLAGGGTTPPQASGELLELTAQWPRSWQQSYLGRRLREAVTSVARQQSARGLNEELKYLSDLDAARQQDSFALVRIIIWATPMLGFLGTVMGITQALGDLGAKSELLASDPKTAMQGLLAGLYVAFDTTALALCLSIVLMFVQFLVDRVETALLGLVDQRTMEELVGCFEESEVAADPQLAVVERMATTVLRTAEQLVGRQTAHWEATLDQVGGKWDQLFVSSADQIRRALTETLDDSLQHLAEKFRELEGEADRQLRGRWEQWQTVLSDNARLLHTQQQELVRQGEVMAKVLHATADVIKLETALNNNLQALAGARNFEDTVMSLAAAIHLLNARLGHAQPALVPVALDSVKQGRAA